MTSTDTEVKFKFVNVRHELEPNIVGDDPAPWKEFCDSFKSPAIKKEKRYLACWSPGIYSFKYAVNDGCLFITALVMDFDNGADPQVFRKTLGRSGLAFLIHSSYSHCDGSPRFRVVIPFSRPVPVAAWPEFYQKVVELYGRGQADPSCKDPRRLYFKPCCPPERKSQYFCWWQDGEFLDPAEYLPAPDPKPAPSKNGTHKAKAISKTLIEGSKHDTLVQLIYRCRKEDRPKEECEIMVRELIETVPASSYKEGSYDGVVRTMQPDIDKVYLVKPTDPNFVNGQRLRTVKSDPVTGEIEDEPQQEEDPSEEWVADRKAGNYAERWGWTYHTPKPPPAKEGKPQPPIEPKILANFIATVKEETLVDDGEEPILMYRIDIRRKKQLHEIEVRAKDYPSMSWVSDKCGAGCIIEAGMAVKDHLRVAILTLSQPVPRRTVYAHTGWRKIDGEWLYLTGGGGIGANGLNNDVDVTLEKNLAPFQINTEVDEKQAVELSLKAMIDIAPIRITAPMWGSVFLAPLTSALGGESPDFVAWVYGPSGVKKSELAAIAQSHFGSFSRTQLPGAFISTVNSIERQWHALKDCLFTMDDYCPSNTRAGADEMERMIDKLTRGVGNRKGRDRMGADTKMRSGLPPRGMVLATSEKHPSGHSGSARCFPIYIGSGDVNGDVLTELQLARGEISGAMFGFLKWLASDYEKLCGTVQSDYFEIRSKVAGAGSHARQASQVAHLLLGLRMFIRYAVSIGVRSQSDGTKIFQDAFKAILQDTEESGERLKAQDPVEVSIQLLRQAFLSGRIYVVNKFNEAPPEYRNWGWKIRTLSKDQSEAVPINDAGFAGYHTDFNLQLRPEAVYAAILDMATKSKRIFHTDQSTVEKLWAERGILNLTTSSGVTRRKKAVKVYGKPEWLYEIPISALSEDMKGENSGDLEV